MRSNVETMVVCVLFCYIFIYSIACCVYDPKYNVNRNKIQLVMRNVLRVVRPIRPIRNRTWTITVQGAHTHMSVGLAAHRVTGRAHPSTEYTRRKLFKYRLLGDLCGAHCIPDNYTRSANRHKSRVLKHTHTHIVCTTQHDSAPTHRSPIAVAVLWQTKLAHTGALWTYTKKKSITQSSAMQMNVCVCVCGVWLIAFSDFCVQRNMRRR